MSKREDMTRVLTALIKEANPSLSALAVSQLVDKYIGKAYLAGRQMG